MSKKSFTWSAHESQQSIRRWLLEQKIRFKPHTPSSILRTVPRRCCCCSLFLFSLFVHFQFVFDTVCLSFRIAWWPSVGKVLSSWLSACAVLLYSVLIARGPFQFDVWVRMWNSVVSVPDQLVFRRTWTDAEKLLKEKSFFILSFVFLSEFVIRQVQTNIY